MLMFDCRSNSIDNDAGLDNNCPFSIRSMFNHTNSGFSDSELRGYPACNPFLINYDVEKEKSLTFDQILDSSLMRNNYILDDISGEVKMEDISPKVFAYIQEGINAGTPHRNLVRRYSSIESFDSHYNTTSVADVENDFIQHRERYNNTHATHISLQFMDTGPVNESTPIYNVSAPHSGHQIFEEPMLLTPHIETFPMPLFNAGDIFMDPPVLQSPPPPPPVINTQKQQNQIYSAPNNHSIFQNLSSVRIPIPIQNIIAQNKGVGKAPKPNFKLIENSIQGKPCDKRQRHNDMEKMRRRYVADAFVELSNVLNLNHGKKPSKAVILSKAREWVLQAQEEFNTLNQMGIKLKNMQNSLAESFNQYLNNNRIFN
ncbi:hypothetical protein HZS_6395 [Henneguya salminicola]|nr:hypothetical protein HZS_6395 [Henneguya salminicola]